MSYFQRRFSAIILCGVLSVFSGSADAADCRFRVTGYFLSEKELLDTLRCLVNELDRVKRKNAVLERRIEELEALKTEVPAVFTNVDGVITEEAGRAIGRASYVLSARSTGGANTLPIEQRVLVEVCGSTGGCAVSVAFRQLSLFDAAVKENLLTGPCQFTYDGGTGNWSLGSGCGDAPKSGRDGDQSAGGNDEKDPVLVQSGGACLFSVSEPARSVGQGGDFSRDHSLGLFLVAMPSRQPNGIQRFQCELVLN